MPFAASELRQRLRSREICARTAGYCGDFAQANLAILPKQRAADYLRFCTRNPKACPLLAVGEPGDWRMPKLGVDLDVRSDVPAYYVYRHGERTEEVQTLNELWRDDLVVFAIGCSFSFEATLQRDGIPLRYIERQLNVPMYRTAERNVPAGAFDWFPLGFCASGIFSRMGAFLTELFPTRMRGSGQGFCYNVGRALGATFPFLIGYMSITMTLGHAIGAFAAAAYGGVILAALTLPETSGRQLQS